MTWDLTFLSFVINHTNALQLPKLRTSYSLSRQTKRCTPSYGIHEQKNEIMRAPVGATFGLCCGKFVHGLGCRNYQTMTLHCQVVFHDVAWTRILFRFFSPKLEGTEIQWLGAFSSIINLSQTPPHGVSAGANFCLSWVASRKDELDESSP